MFALSSQPGAGYFLLVLTGEMGAAEICASNSFLVEMSRQTRTDVVLLDMMAATMMVRPEDVQHIQAHLGASAPPLRRLAIAHKPEDDRGLIRGVAARLGIEYRQFSNLRDAEAWASAKLPARSG